MKANWPTSTSASASGRRRGFFEFRGHLGTVAAALFHCLSVAHGGGSLPAISASLAYSVQQIQLTCEKGVARVPSLAPLPVMSLVLCLCARTCRSAPPLAYPLCVPFALRPFILLRQPRSPKEWPVLPTRTSLLRNTGPPAGGLGPRQAPAAPPTAFIGLLS